MRQPRFVGKGLAALNKCCPAITSRILQRQLYSLISHISSDSYCTRAAEPDAWKPPSSVGLSGISKWIFDIYSILVTPSHGQMSLAIPQLLRQTSTLACLGHNGPAGIVLPSYPSSILYLYSLTDYTSMILNCCMTEFVRKLQACLQGIEWESLQLMAS